MQQDPKSSFEEKEENSLDFKLLLNKLVGIWPIILLSLLFSFLVGFVINRYSIPNYSIRGTVVISDRQENQQGVVLLNLNGMLNTGEAIENVLSVLKSRKITENTIDKIEFGIKYYTVGKVQKFVEIYKNNPIKVVFDSTHLQELNGSFKVKIVDQNSYVLEKVTNGKLFYPSTQTEELNRNIKSNGLKAKKYKFGEIVETPTFKFIVHKSISSEEIASNEVYFMSFSRQQLISQYLGKVSFNRPNRNANLIEAAMVSPIPDKDVIFLETLLLTFQDMKLDEQRESAINTIRFIDEQLEIISDSLGKVEGGMENFQSQNIFSATTNGETYIMQKLASMNEQKSKEVLKVRYLDYLKSYLKNKKEYTDMVSPSSVGIEDPVVLELLSKIISSSAEFQLVKESFSPKTAIYQEKYQVILNYRNSLLDAVNDYYSKLNFTISDLSREIGILDQQVRSIPNQNRKLSDLARRFGVQENMYKFLLEKRI
ncbi:MAG: protein involved in gliding motility EpsB, partial [Bacteroidota bacterium]